jgi:WD40 repeat protein
VVSAAYSSDGKLIITGSEDNTARVWDATSGETLAVIVGGEITPAAGTHSPLIATPLFNTMFSRDGKFVLFVTSGTDHAARIYPWELFQPMSKLMAFAADRAPRALTCEERVTYLHETRACGTPTP